MRLWASALTDDEFTKLSEDPGLCASAEAPSSASSCDMDIESRVRAAGGVMLAKTLVDGGVSTARIKRAVRAGCLMRPSRGWVALPTADPVLTRAAQSRVVLTCVTAAARRGLWDVDERTVHVAVAPHSRPAEGVHARIHWCEPMIPRPPGTLVDSVPNLLSVVADCQPYEEALTIWESAIRRKQITPDTMRTLDLSRRGQRILDDARPFADEGTESILFVRLTWLGLAMRRQVTILGHRVDLLIGDRLVIQIDGGHHVDKQRTSDNKHDARLRLAGYHVIRVSYWQLMHEWHVVQDLILGAVARNLHLAE